MPETNMDLLLLAKQGDSTAFSTLAEQFLPILKEKAGRYQNIAGADTEDLIQEGMIALYRAVQTFNTDKGIRFHTYAATCIKNSMISAIRRYWKNNRQLRNLPFNEMDEHSLYRQTTLHANDWLTDDSLERETTQNRLRQIEVLLSEFEQRVIILYLSGQTYQQISQLLCTTTKAVDNALQRARRKLRPAPR